MAADHLSKRNPDGTVLGQSSGDKIGFFGKTCVTLRSLPSSLTLADTTATHKAATNKIRNMLKTAGFGV